MSGKRTPGGSMENPSGPDGRSLVQEHAFAVLREQSRAARGGYATAPVGKLFRVRVVADSIPHPSVGWGQPRRLRSYLVTYPRCIIAEVNTHRMLSKSSESSRALPAARRRRQLMTSPYFPLRWGRKRAGMGAGADLEREAADRAALGWENVLLEAMTQADDLHDLGGAKEELNRLTEPFALVSTVLTSSEWDNFFALRTHETAHPAFQFLAKAMYVAGTRSTPVELHTGQWHMPFITPADRERVHYYQEAPDILALGIPPSPPFPELQMGLWPTYHLLRWSAARCARVSYGLPDGTPATVEKDDATWLKLVGLEGVAGATWNHPRYLGPGERFPYRAVHASPMEHQGTPADPRNDRHSRYAGNLPGWVQFRKLLGGECVREFDPPAEVVAQWAAEIPDEVFGGPDLY